jgi:hypothetical protein
MIENNVTYEIAKWLKEKGFDQNINNAWFNRVGNYLGICNVKENGTQVTYSNTYSSAELVTREYYNECCSYRYCAPEQWQVVEWLRVNHGIWIYVKLGYGHEFVIQKTVVPFEIVYTDGTFKSPQEAYSAAFDYIKDNNLI